MRCRIALETPGCVLSSSVQKSLRLSNNSRARIARTASGSSDIISTSSLSLIVHQEHARLACPFRVGPLPIAIVLCCLHVLHGRVAQAHRMNCCD